jgi:hypothetical protein
VDVSSFLDGRIPSILDHFYATTVRVKSNWGTYSTHTRPDTKNAGFVIAAGAILGIGAALLWTAQVRRSTLFMYADTSK